MSRITKLNLSLSFWKRVKRWERKLFFFFFFVFLFVHDKEETRSVAPIGSLRIFSREFHFVVHGLFARIKWAHGFWFDCLNHSMARAQNFKVWVWDFKPQLRWSLSYLEALQFRHWTGLQNFFFFWTLGYWDTSLLPGGVMSGRGDWAITGISQDKSFYRGLFSPALYAFFVRLRETYFLDHWSWRKKERGKGGRGDGEGEKECCFSVSLDCKHLDPW